MFGLEIDKTSAMSNTKQLENQIREAILSGKLSAGDRLPPTRNLAKEMQIARNTVIQAYEQLKAEGFLTSIEGSGSYVAEIGKLPKPKLLPYKIRKDVKKEDDIISFDAGEPDIRAFPRITWARLLKEACLIGEEKAFTYHYFSGHPKLKKAIRSYVYRMKGILCEDEQIIIVPGTAGGMEILAKVFERRRNRIAIEDPCIHFVKKVFSDHKYELCSIEVDGQGMVVEKLYRINSMDLIYVVPSHQFPIGGIFPAARRVALLQYASDRNAYIIEDDYDSEFRYKGETLQALWNLDQERVIYSGSFSKIFAPSLRMGYMILPGHLCEQAAYQIRESNLWVNTLEQLAMANFLEERLMDRHIYKMRKLYEGKRIHLIRCLTEAFGNRIEISGEFAGLHLLLSLDRTLNEKDYQALTENGARVDYVEEYAMVKGKHSNQMVLGYGGLSLLHIEEGVRRIKKALG